MKKTHLYFALTLFALTPNLQASHYTFAVILPESIEGRWYWYNTPESQHLVQARIEKELIRAGHTVVDVSEKELMLGLFNNGVLAKKEKLVEQAKALGVTHLITGRAIATASDKTIAYGVSVYRSQADITAKIVDIASSHILTVETGESMEGGQGYVVAGKSALKSAAKDLSAHLLKYLRKAERNNAK